MFAVWPYNSPITIGLGQSFPHGSVGKESVSSAGDPSSIPGLGRSAGEGIGYPLQYSWASLVAQLVKNPPAMRETWVRSLGLGRSPGDGKGYPLQYSGLANSMEYSPWDCKELDMTEQLSVTLNNDKRIGPSGRHNNFRCVYTKQQSLIIHEEKTDKAERRKVCGYS